MSRTLLIIAVLAAGASAQSPAAKLAPQDLIVATTRIVPKLDTPFFHKTETSLNWWISEDDSGKLENTMGEGITAEDLVRIEHTAACVSTHQGEHRMNFCEAVAKEDGAVLQFSGGMPAYASALTVRLDAKGGYECSFTVTYPGPRPPLETKRAKSYKIEGYFKPVLQGKKL